MIKSMCERDKATVHFRGLQATGQCQCLRETERDRDRDRETETERFCTVNIACLRVSACLCFLAQSQKINHTDIPDPYNPSANHSNAKTEKRTGCHSKWANNTNQLHK